MRVADDKTPEVLNAKMDQLVESLGYLDYWDFLAVNKYVLEEMQDEWEQALVNQRDPAWIWARVLDEALENLNYKRTWELKEKWKNFDIEADDYDEKRFEELVKLEP